MQGPTQPCALNHLKESLKARRLCGGAGGAGQAGFKQGLNVHVPGRHRPKPSAAPPAAAPTARSRPLAGEQHTPTHLCSFHAHKRPQLSIDGLPHC